MQYHCMHGGVHFQAKSKWLCERKDFEHRLHFNMVPSLTALPNVWKFQNYVFQGFGFACCLMARLFRNQKDGRDLCALVHTQNITASEKAAASDVYWTNFLHLQVIAMRILAVFDSEWSHASIQSLQKKHQLTLLSDPRRILQLMSTQAFDLILCQAVFEEFPDNVFDVLKIVREVSDIPLIACNSSNKLENSIDNLYVKTLPLLGAQGYVDSEQFLSSSFAQIVEKAVQGAAHTAVGGECTVTSLDTSISLVDSRTSSAKFAMKSEKE